VIHREDDMYGYHFILSFEHFT